MAEAGKVTVKLELDTTDFDRNMARVKNRLWWMQLRFALTSRTGTAVLAIATWEIVRWLVG